MKTKFRMIANNTPTANSANSPLLSEPRPDNYGNRIYDPAATPWGTPRQLRGRQIAQFVACAKEHAKAKNPKGHYNA